MPAFASRLPSTNEYAVVSWGADNQSPHGLLSDAIAAGAAHWNTVNGFDLDAQVITGSTVFLPVTATLVTNALVGMELRLIRPTYGQSICPARAGKGLVTANTANSVTVTWDVVNTTLPPAGDLGAFSFGASNTVVYAGHVYENGDRVIFGGSPLPAEIISGEVYFVRDVAAGSFKLSATLGGAEHAFSTAGAGAAIVPLIGAYVYWPDGRGMTFPSVRVLTPFEPDASLGGGILPFVYPTGYVVPGLAALFPATVTSYDYAGLFLPFTFNEGVEGFGGYGGLNGTPATTWTGTSVQIGGSPGWKTDIFKGAILFTGGQRRVVTSNTADTLSWSGSISPVPPANAYVEWSVPHYRDNFHRMIYGPGFGCPSGHSRPGYLASDQNARTYHRPRGLLSPLYVPVSGTGFSAVAAPRIGPMAEMAFRLSSRIGRRVNVVHLAVDASGIERSALLGGDPYGIGWWTTAVHRDWMVDAAPNLASRLRDLLTIMAQGALVAEGNTKPLKFLGVVGYQGEAEVQTSGREVYGNLLAAVRNWLRVTVHSAGPFFPQPQDVPVIHAGLTSYWAAIDDSFGGLVQTAISDWAALDPAGGTIDLSDVALSGANMTGAGEMVAGRRAGDALAELLDDYVAASEDDTAVDICNVALGLLGETSKIFSLTTTVDQSEQARLCAQFLPIARDAVLEMHSWAFATRFATLTEVTNDRSDWSYAYALPAGMGQPLEVLPPGSLGSAGEVPGELTPLWRAPSVDAALRAPVSQQFVVERNTEGFLVIYTNVADAVLRYNVRISTSVQVPQQFRLAVARKLAALLVGPLAKDPTMAARMEGLAQVDIGRAAAADANRQQHRPLSQQMPWGR